MSPGIQAVLAEIQAERARQDEKWGEQNHPDLAPEAMRRAAWTSAAGYYGMPLADEARQRTDDDAELGVCSWTAIAVEELAEAIEAAEQGDQDAVRTELIQLAAVCVQWAQAIDRRGGAEAASARAIEKLREALSDDSRLASDIRDGRLPLRQPGHALEPQSGNPA